MSNVTPLPVNRVAEASPATESPLSIDSVLQTLEQWRATRSEHHQHTFPDALWHNIFSLATTHSATKIRSLFGISKQQYQKKFDQLYPCSAATPASAKEVPSVAPIDFCEVKPKTTPYQPLKIPAPTTVIVEFCRPDGHLMKIHTTTDNFKALMQAFFAGDFHAANHTAP